MSDDHDHFVCFATDDTLGLFSTENGIHRGLPYPTESHSTSRTVVFLRTETSHVTQASSQKPLSSTQNEGEMCRFAEKPLSNPTETQRAIENHLSEEPHVAPLCP